MGIILSIIGKIYFKHCSKAWLIGKKLSIICWGLAASIVSRRSYLNFDYTPRGVGAVYVGLQELCRNNFEKSDSRCYSGITPAGIMWENQELCRNN